MFKLIFLTTNKICFALSGLKIMIEKEKSLKYFDLPVTFAE